jgi:hypothetical protein
MARRIVMKAETGHINLSAVAFRQWAEDFLWTAENCKPGTNWSPLPYMFLGRAIEYKLKSHLLLTKTREEVKTYNHDIAKLYDDTPAAAQTLSPTERDLLKEASKLYKGEKLFDYPGVREMVTEGRFPDLTALTTLAKKILQT